MKTQQKIQTIKKEEKNKLAQTIQAHQRSPFSTGNPAKQPHRDLSSVMMSESCIVCPCVPYFSPFL